LGTSPAVACCSALMLICVHASATLATHKQQSHDTGEKQSCPHCTRASNRNLNGWVPSARAAPPGPLIGRLRHGALGARGHVWGGHFFNLAWAHALNLQWPILVDTPQLCLKPLFHEPGQTSAHTPFLHLSHEYKCLRVSVCSACRPSTVMLHESNAEVCTHQAHQALQVSATLVLCTRNLGSYVRMNKETD